MTLRIEGWLLGDLLPREVPRLSVWTPEEDRFRDREPGGEEDLAGRVSRLLEQVSRLEQRVRTLRPGEHQEEGGKELKSFARNVLPTLDALDRLVEFAVEAARKQPDLENWRTSIEGVRSRLLKTLERIGLAPFSSVGNPVDLNLHEVIQVLRSTEFPPETVIEERQRGYYFQGKLLRESRVVICQ